MYIPQPGFHQNPMPMSRYPMGFDQQQPLQQVIYSKSKLEHINCIFPPSDDEGGLYIGDTISTLKPELVANNNIGAILCLNQEAAKNAHLSKARFEYKYIEIQDRADYPIKLHFDSANEFIHKNIKDKKNVLVQCHAGVSRSATIICAYLVKHKNKIPQQALHIVKSKRERTKPNAGFAQQIEQYWREINNLKQKQGEINLKTPNKSKAEQKQEVFQNNKIQTPNPETEVKQQKERAKILNISQEKQQKSLSLNKGMLKSQSLFESPKKQQFQSHTQKKPRNSIGDFDLIKEKSMGRASENVTTNTQYSFESMRDYNSAHWANMNSSSNQPVYSTPIYYNQMPVRDPRLIQQTFIHPPQMYNSVGAYPNHSPNPVMYPMNQYYQYYPSTRFN